MEKSFFSEFSSLSAEEQLAKIQLDLGGDKAYHDLLWESPEGVKVHPIYTKDFAPPQQLPSQHNLDWRTTQYITIGEEKETCLGRMQNALDNGIAALYLEFDTPCSFFDELIDEVKKMKCTFFFVFLDQPNKRQMDRIDRLTNAHLCFDLYSTGLCNGSWQTSFETAEEQWVSMVNQQKSASLFVNAATYADAGATIVQQLSFALLQLNEYLNTLATTQHQEIHEVLIQFAYGSNYFFEIAKSKVFSSLAKQLTGAYDFTVKLSIIGVPLQRNKCCTDYNVNLLRTSAEMMSAVLGEVSYVMNHPYDLRFNPPNDFADRIARNQLLLLKHESDFSQIPSPTAGSYYLDTLIEELQFKAWEDFLEGEEKGGWLKMVHSSCIQDAIAKEDAAERERLNCGEQVLVGVTKYQDDSTLSARPAARTKEENLPSFKALPINFLDN